MIVAKTNKICVNHGREFYNRLVKSWLQRNDNEIYSTHKEKNSNFDERFNRTLINTVYKHIFITLKGVYIDKPDKVVDKYTNIYHGII